MKNNTGNRNQCDTQQVEEEEDGGGDEGLIYEKSDQSLPMIT